MIIQLIKEMINKTIKIILSLIISFNITGEYLVMGIQNKSDNKKYSEICENIAKDIELLKNEFPQLNDFYTSKNLNKSTCTISYSYKCHYVNHKIGWTSGVPNPDPDGIWFYICLWDENDSSQNLSQINTQPVMPVWYIKNHRVTYLMLEGENTKSVFDRIMEILKKYGLQESVE